MAKVVYNGKKVSSEDVKTVLEKVSAYFNADVIVTSGDRTTVPRGGSSDSLHLSSLAADFKVSGVSIPTVYEHMKLRSEAFFDGEGCYEVIHHGPHTATTGTHIHLGKRPDEKLREVRFKVEGIDKNSSGKYYLDILLLSPPKAEKNG